MLKGNITPEELESIKSQYPGKPIFKWQANKTKEDILFTTLVKENYHNILSKMNENSTINDMNNLIFLECVVWPLFTPEELDELPVGIFPSVAKSIQEKSFYLDTDLFGRSLGPDVLSEKLSDFYTWDPPEDDVIEDIKTKNPKLPLAKLTVGMWTFIIKSLTRQDVQNIDREEPEDVSIAKVVTIWPTNVDWDMLPYGIFRFITAEANNLGGWDDDIEIEEL